MWVVLFELRPAPGQAARYFELAAALRDELGQIDGFLSVERFESLGRPGVFLSLSRWRDEAALATWRQRACHRAAQRDGRAGVLADYRLQVLCVQRDYGLHDRAQAPIDSNAVLL